MKRSAATVLWFLTGWMVGAMAAFAFGLSEGIAPVIAVAAAFVVALDPARVLWGASSGSAVSRPRSRQFPTA